MGLLTSVARGTFGLGLTALSLLACGAQVVGEDYAESDSEGASIGELKSALTGAYLRTTLASTGFVLRYHETPTAETTTMMAELRAQLYELPASAKNNIWESSYGTVKLDVDPYMISSVEVSAPGDCVLDHWTNTVAQARTALEQDGISLEDFARVHWVFPRDASCGFGGNTPHNLWGNLYYNGSPHARVIAHELGHSLGLSHAYSYTCGDKPMDTPAPDHCSYTEYAHPFDTMGSSGRGSQFSSASKAQVGWFGGCNLLDLERSGTFELAPLEAASNGIQMLRIKLGAGECPDVFSSLGCYLNVEYRQPIGQVAGDPGQDPRAYAGLLLSIGPALVGAGGPGPFLLDMTPGSLWGMYDAALQPGATFTSPGLTSIELLSRTPSRALVKITHPSGANGTATCLGGGAAPPPSTPGTCTDGLKNGLETDVDCGGSACWPCSNGKWCVGNSDCHSQFCSWGGQCQAPVPTCTDGLKNGSETAIDCGGSCSPCDIGQACSTTADCRRGACTGSKCLIPPGTNDVCADNVKNQDESDTDCGGSHCSPCIRRKTCNTNNDCFAQVCENNSCTFGPGSSFTPVPVFP